MAPAKKKNAATTGGQKKQVSKASLKTTPDENPNPSSVPSASAMRSCETDAVLQDKALKIKISRTNTPSEEALPQAPATGRKVATTLSQSEKETALLAKIAAQEGNSTSLWVQFI